MCIIQEQSVSGLKNFCPLLRNIKIFSFSLMLLNFPNKSDVVIKLKQSDGIFEYACPVYTCRAWRGCDSLLP